MLIKSRDHPWLNSICIPVRCAPVESILYIFFKILGAIVPSFLVLAISNFVDSAVTVFNEGGTYSQVFLPGLYIILCQTYFLLFLRFDDLIKNFILYKMKRDLNGEILSKKARLKYRYIEDGRSWNLISRVTNEPEVKVQESFESLFSLIYLIVRVAGIVTILATQVWWAALAICFSALPLLLISQRRGQAEYETDRSVSEMRRYDEYLDKILTSREGVNERTLFSYSDLINHRWNRYHKSVRKRLAETKAKSMVRIKTGGAVNSLFVLFVIFVLLNPVIKGELTLGLFIALVNAVYRLTGQMSWMLSNVTRTLAKANEFLKDLVAFIQLEEEEDVLDAPKQEKFKFDSLEFKKVSFKYPGSEEEIIKDLSFFLDAGHHYALVGVNGAGKTTITKLMTGLYDNYSGRILINGKDQKSFSQSEMKSIYSTVFQDFSKYNISLRDNIALGQLSSYSDESNDELIKDAMDKLGISEWANTLISAWDTPLGKAQEGGVDLSGGQWQRIAMARGIVNPAPVRILDEPTASLDPISESNMYRQFEEMHRDGTTIFISHRLGSTKLADRILVLSEGTLAEEGSHQELMDYGGLYAKMFDSQREWYL